MASSVDIRIRSLIFAAFLCQPAFSEGVLQGVAANIAAATPAVVAGIQASADKAIASINAAASIGMTEMSAAATKHISTNQTTVAIKQIETGERMNSYNQSQVTDRLKMQLAELRAAREQNASLERQRFQAEKELNNMRIALAWQQQEANFELAQMKLQSELKAAGLIRGFKTIDSSSPGFSSIATASLAPPRLLSSLMPPPAAPPRAVFRNSLVTGSSMVPKISPPPAPLFQSDLSSFQESVPRHQTRPQQISVGGHSLGRETLRIE